jgi:hypothetical protein
MKNFMIANLTKKRYSKDNIKILLKAQIDNSLELGWKKEDIILLANFNFEYMEVKSIKKDLNSFCFTGSKMFGIKYLFDNNLTDEPVWCHDIDAWQNIPFSCPDFKEVGVACYSTSKFNGGSLFWRKSSIDIIDKIIEDITSDKLNKEEPTLNRILKSEEYKKRVTILNNTFNVGCSGYVKRWKRSIQPIHVCHFHPYNFIAWETHALDRNGLDTKGITDRLEKLLRKYYPQLATELGDKGKKAQKERKEERLKEENSLSLS